MSIKDIFLINPFHFSTDVIDKLLLVKFQHDPDDYYLAFEPQVFDDDTNGSGHLIIAWRRDGKVDVYYQSKLTIVAKTFEAYGNGLAEKIKSNLL